MDIYCILWISISSTPDDVLITVSSVHDQSVDEKLKIPEFSLNPWIHGSQVKSLYKPWNPCRVDNYALV